MALVEFGSVDDLEDAKPTVVKAGGRELVLMRWQDDVYALRNICPHMSTTMSKGTVMSLRGGTVVGEIAIDKDNPVIACPWHQYEYSLKDGHCLTDTSLRIRSYPVTLEDGKIFVDLEGHRSGKAGAKRASAAAAG